MANPNNPRGFEPIQPILRMNRYTKTTAAAIFPGDAVSLPTSGKVAVTTAGNIEMVGVAAAYAAAADTDVLVMDSPDQQYYCRDDGVGGTLAVASIGGNLDHVATAGDTTFFKSKHALDTSTITTAAAGFRVIGIHPDDEVGKYARFRVVINEHAWAKKTAGI